MKNITVLSFACFCALGSLQAQQNIRVLGLEVLKPTTPLIEDLLKMAGYTYTFDYAPAARMTVSLKKDLYDLTFFLSEQNLTDLPDYEIIPIPVYFNEYFAYSVDPQEKSFDSKEMLEKKTVAYVRGYKGVADFLKGRKNVIEVADENQGFKMLGAGRIDYFIASRASGKIFGPQAQKPVFMLSPAVFQSNLYIVVSKQRTKLKEDLQKMLEKKLKDGSWERESKEILKNMGL